MRPRALRALLVHLLFSGLNSGMPETVDRGVKTVSQLAVLS